ncbi:hypothetical protein MNBD_GAMMA09-1943 [hydrothermal vent metagenome]|uniref:START domain-containing protein n=1 Tax=hydrothermal vent metagenome TaxID=652676 RepID=A0A3B0YKU4_9ZZZZ
MINNITIKKRLALLVITITVLFAIRLEATVGEWTLITDKEGVQVYIADVENTDIVKAKSITKIKATIDQVQLVLNNLARRSEWVPFLKKSQLVEVYSENSSLEYSLFSAPWPASDRDFLYSMKRLSASTERHVYEMRSVKNGVVPEINKLVRGEIIESRYTLTRINNELTQVELIYHADPKGWLPNWIINIIQKILPYKILKNLKSKIENNRN